MSCVINWLDGLRSRKRITTFKTEGLKMTKDQKKAWTMLIVGAIVGSALTIFCQVMGWL